MGIDINEAINILSDYGINAHDDEFTADAEEASEIGSIGENEIVHDLSLDDLQAFGELETSELEEIIHDNEKLKENFDQVREILERIHNHGIDWDKAVSELKPIKPPESICAWYAPIHYFGNAWGIYIREECWLDTAVNFSFHAGSWGNHDLVNKLFSRYSIYQIYAQILRCGFYYYFLHEQFHHKIESLGFRHLIATGSDRYRPYKSNVYWRHYCTHDCLEEALANADSYRRLRELRFRRRIDPDLIGNLKSYLKYSFSSQPDGYNDAIKYLKNKDHKKGLFNLQSQVLDGTLNPKTNPDHWVISPNVITSLFDITDDIHIIVPIGTKPIISTKKIDVAFSASSRNLTKALTKHYGCEVVKGGKGSHVKFKNPKLPNFIIPGSRKEVSIGILKQVYSRFSRQPFNNENFNKFMKGELPW